MLTKPRWLLHGEGAAILVLSLYFYYFGHFSWRLFALLFLVPDLSMLGYLRNANYGAASYNFVHTITLPMVLLLLASWLPAQQCFPYALVWISHIGFDRMLSYGLKYPTFFKDTHFAHV